MLEPMERVHRDGYVRKTWPQFAWESIKTLLDPFAPSQSRGSCISMSFIASSVISQLAL